MANHAPPRKRRHHRLFRFLLVLVVTPVLIATNLLGTVPDNLLSNGLRQAVSLAFPPEFVVGLNVTLDNYGMPTLPPAPEDGVLVYDDTGIEAAIETPGEATAVSGMTGGPTATVVPPAETASPVPETPTFQAQTPEMDISGTWTYQYSFARHEEYTFEDVVTIVQQGGGYVVTLVTNNFGPVTLVDQYWSGSYLEFCYEIPASTFPYQDDQGATGYIDCLTTLGMEDGYLITIDELDIMRELTRIN